jgi:hypothetical protein
MLIDQIAEIVHLAPARQNQVCFKLALAQGKDRADCIFTPTLEFFDRDRTAFLDPDMLYGTALFHTGLAVGELCYWLDEQGMSYHIDESIAERTHQVYGGAAAAVGSSMSWIKEVTVAWIYQQIREGSAPFQGYEFDHQKCHRDLDFMLYAFMGDLAQASNEKTAFIASCFWDKDGQPVSRTEQELAIHRWIKTLLLDWVLAGREYPGPTTYTRQSQLDRPVEPGGRAWLEYLYNSFLIVREHGLAHQPPLIQARWSQDHIKVTVNV